MVLHHSEVMKTKDMMGSSYKLSSTGPSPSQLPCLFRNPYFFLKGGGMRCEMTSCVHLGGLSNGPMVVQSGCGGVIAR